MCDSDENPTVEEQNAELDEAIGYNGKEEKYESKLVAGQLGDDKIVKFPSGES